MRIFPCHDQGRCFDLIIRQGRIGIDREDIFQDKLDGVGLVRKQRIRWSKQMQESLMARLDAEMKCAWEELGAYRGNADYSHISPNSCLLMQVGLSGLLERVNRAAERNGLTEKQKEFYSSCQIMLAGCQTLALRLAAAIEPHNRENSIALNNSLTGICSVIT